MALNRNQKIGVFVVIVIVLIVFLTSSSFFGSDEVDLNLNNMSDDTKLNELPELVVEDLVLGEGAVATRGGAVAVHYVGRLTDGTEFDSSLKNGKPFVFLLGTGAVIRGWDQGLEGMKVGGVRRLTIPPELGYGSLQAGPIPPNSTLIFEVELLGVETQTTN